MQDLGLVQPKVSAGDVVFFMGVGTTHGAWAVTGDRPRRCALFAYSSRHEALAFRKIAARSSNGSVVATSRL